MRCRAIDVRSV